MQTSHRHPRFFLFLVAPVALIACGGGSSTPTSPGLGQVSLQSATVSVAGQVVNGMTVTPGHGDGASTRFEAVLAGAGMPAAGATVTVAFDRPAGMGMGGMMGASGTLHLYDDGTHGDRTAGDGIYCYEDFAGDYGCHAAGAPVGQYHYDFWGSDPYGNHSNHMAVVVTVR